jgi:exosome complex RNA-binding protein Rrp42 (RNase PH superfamily)
MIVNTKKISDMAKQGLRMDNRALDQYRSPIKIETGISWTAEGSARVQIGGTVVKVES